MKIEAEPALILFNSDDFETLAVSVCIQLNSYLQASFVLSYSSLRETWIPAAVLTVFSHGGGMESSRPVSLVVKQRLLAITPYLPVTAAGVGRLLKNVFTTLRL